MATLTVTYTPQYEGCHKIWIKLPSDTEYCKFLDSSASVIGTPKDFDIEVTPELLTCLGVSDINCSQSITINGLIIPCCASETDPAARVTFTFNATVTQCKRYLVECKGSGVRYIEVLNPGSGYSSPPSVTIPGADPAIAVAYLAADSVDYIEVTDPGAAIAPPFPPVTLSAPDLPGGVQATAQIRELYPCGDGLGTISITDCLGNELNVSTVEPDVEYYICSTTVPVNNQGSETTITPVVDSTGCCTCRNYRLTNTSKFTAQFEFFDCDHVFNTYNLTSLATVDLCMIQGTLNFLKGYPDVTVLDLGNCP
jgi:hypothetical protein